MTTLYLCKIPELDKTYENVVDFNSSSTRRNFFLKRKVWEVEWNGKADSARTQLTVNLALDVIVTKADYLFFKGNDGKDYFYFIDSIEYNTPSSVMINVTLDVFTTYCLDFEIQHSFVERCHVDRWEDGIPSVQLVNEDLPVYQYVVKDSKVIAEMTGGIVYTSSTPLGKLSGGSSSGGGGSENLTSGKPSKFGFRFIKGYEGFTSKGLRLSGESFNTVGYGSTERYNPEAYNAHKPFPCSEQKASEIYKDRIVGEFGARIYEALQESFINDQVKQNEFDAMCSLAYNRGINGFLNDPTSPFQLIKKNPQNYTEIRRVWESYASTSSGQQLPGLVARRKAEANIYCNNEYEMRPISVIIEDHTDPGVGVYGGTLTDNNGNGFIPSDLPGVEV